MLSKFLEFVLVATSISPIFIIFSILEFLTSNKITYKSVIWILLFLICIITFWGIKKFAERFLPRQTIKVVQIEPADKEVSAFLVAYILPFLGISKTSLSFEIAIVIVLYIVVLTSSNYHFNPILSLLGYHYYQITISENGYSYSYILMTKKTIKDCKNIKTVILISDYMVLEVTK